MIIFFAVSIAFSPCQFFLFPTIYFCWLIRNSISFPTDLPSVHLLQKRHGADHESVEAETMPTNSRQSLVTSIVWINQVASNIFCNTFQGGRYMYI